MLGVRGGADMCTKRLALDPNESFSSQKSRCLRQMCFPLHGTRLKLFDVCFVSVPRLQWTRKEGAPVGATSQPAAHSCAQKKITQKMTKWAITIHRMWRPIEPMQLHSNEGNEKVLVHFWTHLTRISFKESPRISFKESLLLALLPLFSVSGNSGNQRGPGMKDDNLPSPR